MKFRLSFIIKFFLLALFFGQLVLVITSAVAGELPDAPNGSYVLVDGNADGPDMDAAIVEEHKITISRLVQIVNFSTETCQMKLDLVSVQPATGPPSL